MTCAGTGLNRSLAALGLWVHASELNRVYFGAWSWAQLGVGGLAVVLAWLGRAPRLPTVLLLLAVGLAALKTIVILAVNGKQ